MNQDREREVEKERRELEAERLEIPVPRPGDDPPTYGDEGGGAFYPERTLMEPPGSYRPTFFQRLLLARYRRAGRR
jgi:hypothetical protein